MDKDLEKDFQRMVILSNLAYLLADVSNTFCIEAGARFKRIGNELAREEKMKFNRMADASRKLKAASKEVTKSFYKVETVEAAVDDSDYFAKLILLIVDRIGENEELQQQLVELIRSSFTSKLHLMGD
jgi:hypothetical protein